MSDTYAERGDWITEYGDRPFITLDEAAELLRVSPRTARRWASNYVASDGEYGIPVLQVTQRRRLVPLDQLLDPGAPRSRR
ncbi:MAG: helix-turn-helix domain-containing protein [Actinomycetota bacterium]